MHAIPSRTDSVIAPYDEIRVVDLSTRFSGALAARLFGDFGAEVLLLESGTGHPLRAEPPYLDGRPGPERSFIHAFANWNKKSINCVDEDERRTLIASADVVVTTSVDSEFLNEIKGIFNPKAVHLSITAHGLNDPLTNVPGNNLTLNARCGWASINGYGGEAPLALPRNQNGIVGGVTGFIAAAAALRHRNAEATAEQVDVSELEALALTVHPWGVAGAYNQAVPRMGKYRTRARGSPGPLWELSDGRMNFGLADFKNWTPAMDAVNLPELGRRKELIPDIGRHSQDLREVVHGLAETLPHLKRWDVFHRLTQLRCVVGVVQDTKDLLDDQQLNARSFFTRTTIDGQEVATSGAPAKLSPAPWDLSTPAPELGSTKASTLNSKNSRPNSTHPNLDEEDLREGPLAGVRVLSFGQAWSGTFATELLALLGADVVQIASHYHPDAFRRIRNTVPPLVEDATRKQHPRNTQGHYNSVNLHKREITLDLRHKKGQQILWELIPNFDMLIDNFRPNVLPSWGINLQKLNEARPGAIWASISGYGESGPFRDYPANGATTEPMSGFSSVHGYSGEQGMNTGGLYPDPISGYFLAATVLAALNHRDKTGEPQRIDLSMMEAVSTVIGDHIMEFSSSNEVRAPTGNSHENHAPHGIYPTLDEYWVAIAVESDEMWESLRSIIDDPSLNQPEFENERSRLSSSQLLDERVSNWTAQRNADDVEATLTESGIAAARVVPLVEIYGRPDPHFIKSGFLQNIDHPEAGKTWLPGRPWRFSSARQVPVRPAPCVGEHSYEVFRKELGIDEETYKQWVSEGITGSLDELS